MVSEVTEAFFCWHSKQFFAEIDLQALHKAQDSPNATLASFSSEHKTCISHWIFLSTIKPEATTNQVSGKVVTDPAGRRVSHNSGRKKNTTLDCGAVLLPCDLSFLASGSSMLRAGLGCRDTGNGVTETTSTGTRGSVTGTRFGTGPGDRGFHPELYRSSCYLLLVQARRRKVPCRNGGASSRAAQWRTSFN